MELESHCRATSAPRQRQPPLGVYKKSTEVSTTDLAKVGA